jgi:hypothetical protein
MTYQDSRPLAGNRMMSLIGGFLSGVILMNVFLHSLKFPARDRHFRIAKML